MKYKQERFKDTSLGYPVWTDADGDNRHLSLNLEAEFAVGN